MGNIESASISISSQILGSENRYNQNNKPCTRIAIQSVDIALTLLCTKTDNLNLGLMSKTHVGDWLDGYTQEYIICSAKDVQECNLFKFDKGGFVSGSQVVQLLDAESNVTDLLVLGVDYSVTPHGIELLKDILLTNQKYLRITYNYDDRPEQGLDEFNFLSEFQGHKYLYFKGTNYAEGIESDDPFSVEIYRVLFNPVSQLDLISNGSYFVINLAGRIEKHFENEEDGLGGYFKIKRGKYT